MLEWWILLSDIIPEVSCRFQLFVCPILYYFSIKIVIISVKRCSSKRALSHVIEEALIIVCSTYTISTTGPPDFLESSSALTRLLANTSGLTVIPNE